MPNDQNGNDKPDRDNEIPFSEEWERVIGGKVVDPDTVIDTLPPPRPNPPQNEDKTK